MTRVLRRQSTNKDEEGYVPEEYLLLRVPVEKASEIRKSLQDHTLKDRLAINLHEVHEGGKATVVFDGKELRSKVVNLPTINEIHKTIDDDRYNFYKCGDLNQMLICEEPDATPSKSLRILFSLSNDVEIPEREGLGCPPYPHGVTPPLKNVKKKRFRVMAKAELDADKDVAREVQRLIDLDHDALSTTYQVISDMADEGTPLPDQDSTSEAVDVEDVAGEQLSEANNSSSESDDEQVVPTAFTATVSQPRAANLSSMAVDEGVQAAVAPTTVPILRISAMHPARAPYPQAAQPLSAGEPVPLQSQSMLQPSHAATQLNGTSPSTISQHFSAPSSQPFTLPAAVPEASVGDPLQVTSNESPLDAVKQQILADMEAQRLAIKNNELKLAQAPNPNIKKRYVDMIAAAQTEIQALQSKLDAL